MIPSTGWATVAAVPTHDDLRPWGTDEEWWGRGGGSRRQPSGTPQHPAKTPWYRYKRTHNEELQAWRFLAVAAMVALALQHLG
jgi:hypothetical protein